MSSTNPSGLMLRRLQTIIDTGKDENGKELSPTDLHNLIAEVKDLQTRVFGLDLKEKYEEAAKKYGWHVVETHPHEPPTPPVITPLPQDGRKQEKGANQDANVWKVVQMRDDATKYKVVDDKDVNVADNFGSSASAEQYIQHFKDLAANGGGGGGGGGVVTEGMIYEVKDGGFSMNKLTKSGSAGASDGLRQNFRQFPNTLLAFEATWVDVTLKGDPSKATDKPHWSIKTGTHNHSSPGTGAGRTALIEDTWQYKGSGGKARSETGNKGYGSCNGLENFNSCPAFKGDEVFSAKLITYPSQDGSEQVMEWWLAFGKGSTDYKPYSRITDSGNGSCECGRIITSDKKWQGPAEYLETTLRMNGADFTLDFDKSSLVEIVPPATSKITPQHAMAARKQKIKEPEIKGYFEEE